MKSDLKKRSKKFLRNVKKLIYQNRFSMEEIANITDSTIEECIDAFEVYTGEKIPASFLIAGNRRQI